MAVVDSAPSPVRRTPVRTCVGCRVRAAAAELLRVVAVEVPPASEPPPGTDGSRTSVRVEPDPRHRAPGRGAWIHPRAECVQIAERRRAFTRALRVPGTPDAAPVAAWVREHGTTDG